MRNLMTSAMVVLTMASTAQTIGVKGGLSICTFQAIEDTGFESGDELSDNMNGLSFNAGLYYTKHLGNEKMHLQVEGLYSAMRSDFKEVLVGEEHNGVYIGENGNPDGTTRIESDVAANYVSVPILFKYDVTEKISLHVGPAINYLVSYREENEISNVSVSPAGGFITASEESCCESIRSEFALDLQGVAGVEFEIGDGFDLGLRYNYGFNDFYGSFRDSEDFFEADEIVFVENRAWRSIQAYLAIDIFDIKGAKE